MIEVVVLGSGSAVPTRERAHPSIWLRHMGETFLFDCGEGTQRQLMFSDLSYGRIDNVCITHWHADHSVGLIGLLQTMEMEAAARQLHVFAADCKQNLEYVYGFAGRPTRFDVIAHDVPPAGGPVKSTAYYKLSAFPTVHGQRSYGFVFEEKDRWNFDMEKVNAMNLPVKVLEELREKLVIKHNGRTLAIGTVAERTPGKKVVYTGDTMPSEVTVAAAKDADVLIHEATYLNENDKRDRYHSTAEDAARIAKQANVKQLVLIHFSKMYKDVKEHVKLAKKIFPNTIAAEDLMELKLV